MWLWPTQRMSASIPSSRACHAAGSSTRYSSIGSRGVAWTSEKRVGPRRRCRVTGIRARYFRWLGANASHCRGRVAAATAARVSAGAAGGLCAGGVSPGGRDGGGAGGRHAHPTGGAGGATRNERRRRGGGRWPGVVGGREPGRVGWGGVGKLFFFF